MRTQIKEIFTNALTALNLTIIDEQEEAIFNLINRKYFSIVKPLSKAIKKDIFPIKDEEGNTLLKLSDLDGVEVSGDNDFLSLDIGDYKVFEVIDQKENKVVLKTEPTDYNNYKISINYMDSYQTVCEAILERFEGYNMQTLKGIGVEDIEQRLDLSYDVIEQMLYKKHTVLGFDLV